MPCGCNTSAARTHTPTPCFRAGVGTPTPVYHILPATRLFRATASTHPRIPWPGARHRRRFAAERGTQESARYHERQDRDREHHDIVHPPHPVLPIGRSLPNRPRPPTNSLLESLAARLAWRRSAVAPWLCVTAFRRLCSWQRFAFSRVHGSARGPGGVATHAPPLPRALAKWRQAVGASALGAPNPGSGRGRLRRVLRHMFARIRYKVPRLRPRPTAGRCPIGSPRDRARRPAANADLPGPGARRRARARARWATAVAPFGGVAVARRCSARWRTTAALAAGPLLAAGFEPRPVMRVALDARRGGRTATRTP